MKLKIKLAVIILLVVITSGIAGMMIQSGGLTPYSRVEPSTITKTAVVTVTHTPTTTTATAPPVTTTVTKPAMEPPVPPPAPTDGDSITSQPDLGVSLSDRLIVYVASIGLNVSSVHTGIAQLQQIATSEGGYIATTSLQPILKGTWVDGRVVAEQAYSATVVLKIPAERYYEVESRILKLGDVVSYSLNTKDVTESMVDLEARLKNVENVLAQYTMILSKAERVEDILSIQMRIDDIQERIEVLKAQIQNVKRQVSYATITISLSEPLRYREMVEVKEDPFSRAVTNSLSLATSALTIELSGFIFLVAGLFPIWIILGLSYFIYKRVYVPRRKVEQRV